MATLLDLDAMCESWFPEIQLTLDQPFDDGDHGWARSASAVFLNEMDLANRIAALQYVFLVSSLTLAEMRENVEQRLETANDADMNKPACTENPVCSYGAIVDLAGCYAPDGRYILAGSRRLRALKCVRTLLENPEIGPSVFLCPDAIASFYPRILVDHRIRLRIKPAPAENPERFFLRKVLLHELGHHIFPVSSAGTGVCLSEGLANLFSYIHVEPESAVWLYAQSELAGYPYWAWRVFQRRMEWLKQNPADATQLFGAWFMGGAQPVAKETLARFLSALDEDPHWCLWHSLYDPRYRIVEEALRNEGHLDARFFEGMSIPGAPDLGLAWYVLHELPFRSDYGDGAIEAVGRHAILVAPHIGPKRAIAVMKELSPSAVAASALLSWLYELILEWLDQWEGSPTSAGSLPAVSTSSITEVYASGIRIFMAVRGVVFSLPVEHRDRWTQTIQTASRRSDRYAWELSFELLVHDDGQRTELGRIISEGLRSEKVDVVYYCLSVSDRICQSNVDIVPRVLECMSHANQECRSLARQKLVEMGKSEAAADVMLQQATSVCWPHRIEALEGIAETNFCSTAIAETLLDLATSGTTQSMVPSVNNGSPEESVRAKSSMVLGRLARRHESALQALCRGAIDGDSSSACLRGLKEAQRNDPVVCVALATLAQSEMDWWRRTEALKLFGELRCSEVDATEIVIAIAANPDSHLCLRCQALGALSEVDLCPDAAQKATEVALGVLVDTASTDLCRTFAVEVLGAHGGQAPMVLDVLRRAARGEFAPGGKERTSSEVAGCASGALARLGHANDDDVRLLVGWACSPGSVRRMDGRHSLTPLIGDPRLASEFGSRYLRYKQEGNEKAAGWAKESAMALGINLECGGSQ